MPTVAIAGDFLDAFARIPRAQQRKVREFTEKFRDDPKSSAINYEKIRNVKDPKVRTVRIDQKYRAIILHPDDGDVYVLVWVDNHDQAMAWAQKRTFDVNPFTGALQISSAKEAQDAVGEKPKKKRQPGLLDDFDDECLLSFGIPSVLLPAVRAVEKPEQLLALTKHLPAEAAEAIVWLAEKYQPKRYANLSLRPRSPKSIPRIWPLPSNILILVGVLSRFRATVTLHPFSMPRWRNGVYSCTRAKSVSLPSTLAALQE